MSNNGIENMRNEILTIAIPTYNRAAILDEALQDLIPKINDFKFEIIVCDNASTDGTKSIVDKYKSQYPYITYFKQEKNIFDKNFITCYNLSVTKYIWLLGDSSRILKEHLPAIYSILKSNDYDAVVVNAHNRIKGICSRNYTEPHNFLADIGWQIGLISSTIVSKKMTTEEYVWRYRETNFIHFGLVIEYMCKNSGTNIYWLNEHVATHTRMNKTSTSWLPMSFDVYGKGYMVFVLSLPSQIPVDIKLQCIKDHSLNQGIFEYKNIFAMRSKGWLNYKMVKRYRHYIPFLTNTPLTVFFIVSLTPRFIVKLVHRIYHFVKKREIINY